MLNRHFREFIGLLEKHGVGHLASPRAKDKIDFEELKRIRG